MSDKFEYYIFESIREGSPIHRFNELGAEGWELVAFYYGPSGWTDFIFKRVVVDCVMEEIT